MKAAPVYAALRERAGIQQTLVHTGQHYDYGMSEIFFQQLALPAPDVNLEVGSGTHTAQTAQIMLRLEPVLLERRPDLVVVYGDVNSTLAAALVCAKLGIPLAHVEAGLRSFDRTMPEEVNRLLTDQVADLLFTPSQDADVNLSREGISKEKIHLVGNVMIDTLVRLLPLALRKWQGNSMTVEGIVVEQGRYILTTLHRPSNVDDPETLQAIMNALSEISESVPVVFPVHPRTRQRLNVLTDVNLNSALHLVSPLGYLDFLALEGHALAVITDSGGIQEETTFLNVPCLTVRENTERPVTVTMGTNILVGRDFEKLVREVRVIVKGIAKRGSIPPLWDGNASERIADTICRWGE
ncbi:MAG: UDP-N-acetylglucosamine 2-epimerase (non-hydrolyzing) [candidate division WOR-3 bacterium]